MTKIRANNNNTRSRKNFTNNRNSNNNNRRILQTANPSSSSASIRPTRRTNNSSLATSSILATGKMLQTHNHQQQPTPQSHQPLHNPNSNFKAATNSNLVNINNLNYGTPANNNSNNMYRVVNNTSKKINSKPNKQSGRNSFSSGANNTVPSHQTPFVQQFNNNAVNQSTRYRGGPATRNMTSRRQSQPQQVANQQQHPMMFQPIQTAASVAPTAVLNDVTVNLTRDEPRLVIFNASLNNQTKPNKNMFHFNNKFNSYHPFQFHPKSHAQQIPSSSQQQHNQQSGFNPFRTNPSQVRTRSYYKNLRTQLQLNSGNTNSKFQPHGGGQGVLIPASGKFKAPYNTTQYIMFDYSRRMPALKDLQCPSEQQQFDNDWDMAMLSEALTPSATFKPIIMPGATVIGDDSDDEVELIYMDPNHAPIKKSTSESQLLLLESGTAGSQSGQTNRLLADTPMTTDDENHHHHQKHLLSTSI